VADVGAAHGSSLSMDIADGYFREFLLWGRHRR
jgi:hypothetical protein